MLSACAKEFAYGDLSWKNWMHDFIGFFLVVFSMFKFFDMEGFADGFQMYDLLATPLRPYAYIYPFIELALGLGYLSHWRATLIYSATIIVLGFGSIGVLRALFKGLDIECACMGTVLHVPLSTVALVEDLGQVLFIDIVGYAKVMITEQTNQLQTLREIVRSTEQFKKAEAEGELLRLPTGDGGALVCRTAWKGSCSAHSKSAKFGRTRN